MKLWIHVDLQWQTFSPILVTKIINIYVLLVYLQITQKVKAKKKNQASKIYWQRGFKQEFANITCNLYSRRSTVN